MKHESFGSGEELNVKPHKPCATMLLQCLQAFPAYTKGLSNSILVDTGIKRDYQP